MPEAVQATPDRAPAPADELRHNAEAYLRRRHPGRRPAAWQRPGFLREVGLVRAHLSPIHSRASLAAAHGREAFAFDMPHHRADVDARVATSPVHVAYAIRWLELADVASRRSTAPRRTEDHMPRKNRESARARRERLVVRVDDARRRRQIASARVSIRGRLVDRDATTRSAAASPEAVGWFG